MARPKKFTEAPEQDAIAFVAVQMTRSAEDAKGGPVCADVHPDEVHNYAAGGWQIKGV